jgi:nucleoside-diphosphate kinase
MPNAQRGERERQATLVIIKPDALCRGLAGAVITRLEGLHLQMIGAKVTRVSRELAEEHYKALRGKPFFGELIQHICGTLHNVEVVPVFVYYGEDAIARVRQVVGATNPEKAEPTSLRGAFGRMTTAGIMENVIHSSSDEQDAVREIKLWFRPEELIVKLYSTKEGARRGLEWA